MLASGLLFLVFVFFIMCLSSSTSSVFIFSLSFLSFFFLNERDDSEDRDLCANAAGNDVNRNGQMRIVLDAKK